MINFCSCIFAFIVLHNEFIHIFVGGLMDANKMI